MKEFLKLTEQSQKLQIQFQQVRMFYCLTFPFSVLFNTGNLVVLWRCFFSVCTIISHSLCGRKLPPDLKVKCIFTCFFFWLCSLLWLMVIAPGRRDTEEHQPQQHSSWSSAGQAAAYPVPTTAGGSERGGQGAPGEEQWAAAAHQPITAPAERDGDGEFDSVLPLELHTVHVFMCVQQYVHFPKLHMLNLDENGRNVNFLKHELLLCKNTSLDWWKNK